MNLLINLQRKINKNKATISVLGLGYVGLPVAYNFSKKFNVIGFDINKNRVSELKNNKDNNNSISYKQLKEKKILFTNNFKNWHKYFI